MNVSCVDPSNLKSISVIGGMLIGIFQNLAQPAVLQLTELLPVTPEELLQVAAQDDVEDTENANFLLEPSPKALLGSILPLYVTNLLVQMVLEGKASEQSARMVAMKSATENATTLIGELTLEYNQARQTQITNELLEITTAMKAME